MSVWGGFLLSLLVADKVEVRTRKAGSAKQGTWTSDGVESYEITAVEDLDAKIIMHLKDEAKSFLEEWQLRKVITTYSDHLGYPITMFVEREVAEEADGESESDADADSDGEPKEKTMRKEIKKR